MGILDNLEASLDLLWDKSLDKYWEDSDLELSIQNPHLSTN
jgi:hypothetical protein